MKFNPSTNELFTDKGQFIKKLQCHHKVAWETLREHPAHTSSRQCSQCDHPVIDTSCYDEEALLKMLTDNPTTCLKLSLKDPSLLFIHGKHRRHIR